MSEIIEKVKEELLVRCKKHEEKVGYDFWNEHIKYVYEESKNLANIYKGLLVGADSGLQTMVVNNWSQRSSHPKKMLPYLTHTLNPLFSYNGFNVTAGSIVNSK